MLNRNKPKDPLNDEEFQGLISATNELLDLITEVIIDGYFNRDKLSDENRLLIRDLIVNGKIGSKLRKNMSNIFGKDLLKKGENNE